MNYKYACKILDLDETKPHDTKTIKKSYHALALRYHPDKNNDEEAIHFFKEVNEAYHYLNHNTRKTETFVDFVTSSWNNVEIQKVYVDALMVKVFSVCETHSESIIMSLELPKFILIYKLYTKYKHLLQFSIEFDNFMEKRKIYLLSQGSLKERQKKNRHLSELSSPPASEPEEELLHNKETMILRPFLDDVIVDNVYKYSYLDHFLLIPLWHHEIEYDISGEFVVKILPKLPSVNYWIDKDNNLHQSMEYTISELWDCALENKHMEIFFGKKRFIFYPHDLQLKKTQIWTWKTEGISRINNNNIYDVSIRSDVVLHISISGIL